MPLDPSISLQAGQGVPAMVNPLTQFGQAASISNALAQNKLIGASTQNALDTNRNIKLQGDAAAQGLGAAGNAQVGAMALSVARLPDADMMNAAHQGLQTLLSGNVISPQQAQSYNDLMAQTKDPAHLRTMLTMFGQRTLSPEANMQQVQGAPIQGSNGATTLYGTRSMSTGAPTWAGGVPMQLTPQDKVSTQPAVGANGVPGTVPVGAKYDASGNLLPAPIPTGYVAPGSPPPAPANPPGFTATAAPPDFAPNQAAFQTAQGDVAPANTRIQSLQEARNALDLTNSGPGEASIQKVRAFMQARGMPDFFTGQSDAATALATANKYLLKYAASSAPGNTDAGRAIAQDSNANTGQPQPATMAIIKNTIGQERLTLAATQTAPDPSGAGFLAHRAEFTSKYDPRAFSADLYSPAELTKIQQSLSKDQTGLKKFYDGLAKAKQLGIISTPGQ